ncbi:alpha/beta fold hydrolase [Amycolatopsis sp. 3B14]|uniref:alpha/beta fold hydrolase n=1 Tax=Amycolatopsis sp. 3B14 TaxID=3243600 RepID=UPI003D975535
MDIRTRNAVTVAGRPGGQPMVFAHGFGCDQAMWRLVTPAFEPDYQLVLFDYVGAGGSDLGAWRPERYATLDGYADDVLEICAELDLEEVVFVGHSVSSMVGVLAAAREPSRFAGLVMVCPSPCYLDDDGYTGGFTRPDIDELLESLDSNYLGWSAAMAPVIMGNPDRPHLGAELTNSFCRTDPHIAREFARVTFLSDNRDDLAKVPVPSLVLQSRHDAIAPVPVGEYVHEQLPDSELVVLEVNGHCPHLSDPDLTTAAIGAFLARRGTR